MHAQSKGDVRVYKNQFLSLSSKIDSILSTIDDVVSDKQSLRYEFSTYTKLVHRLQETVEENNIEEIYNNGQSNKILLLISQGCISLDFVISSLDKFIETNDRAFIKLARDGNILTNQIKSIL
jgi:hypothetical protein